MPIKEKIHVFYDLFLLIKSYFTCPGEIFEDGHEVFETSIIESMRYAKTGKKSW